MVSAEVAPANGWSALNRGNVVLLSKTTNCEEERCRTMNIAFLYLMQAATLGSTSDRRAIREADAVRSRTKLTQQKEPT
jgi:hypothetical protein